MKWFMNLKIATKLIIGFLIVAVITVAMGVFCLLNIMTLNKSDTELYKDMLVPVTQMAKISEAFQRQNVNLRQALLDINDQDVEAELQKFQDRRIEIETQIAEFEKTTMTDTIRKAFNDFKSANETLKPLQDKAIEMIKKDQKLDTMALIAEDGEAGIAVIAEQDAIENVIKLKDQDAKYKADVNSGNAQTTIIITGAILLGVLALAVTIGIIISRIISKPIKAAANCARALASGNLDEPLIVDTKDEVGQLASTIDKEVRQAFRDIEHARIVSDKQTKEIEKVYSVSEKQAQYQANEVNKLLVNLQRLSRGELLCDIVVDPGDQDTEALNKLFNEIAKNLGGGVEAIKGYIQDISIVLSDVSEGNLCVDITSEYHGDFIELKKSINNIISSLNNILVDINASAEQVASGTNQVSEGSQNISQGATEQASSIDELSASITQIAEQTKQNALNANTANDLANAAKKDAAEGNEQMKAMQKAMVEINDSSVNISKIIKVIDDIAFQTNILALNAAVEAARAGAHGKGFAVVAEEVRNLAARSAQAAKETTDLIEGSIKKVEIGSKIADQTASALNNIVNGVDKAAQLVGDIAVASNEQATGITQINKAIEQLSLVVQQNSATSEEAASASVQLSSQAELLKSMVGQFNLKKKADKAPQDEKNIDNVHSNFLKKPKIILNDMEFGKY